MFHLEVAVLGVEVDVDGQHHLDVGFFLEELAWWGGDDIRSNGHGCVKSLTLKQRELPKPSPKSFFIRKNTCFVFGHI